MKDNLTIKKTKYETVFEFSIGDERRIEGSQRIANDEVHVHWAHYVNGETVHNISATRRNIDEAKVFFYSELRGRLGGSWLIMRTLIDKEIEVFRKKIHKIQRKIPAAVAKKYEEILGPLEDINQDVLDKAAVELKLICEGWSKK